MFDCIGISVCGNVLCNCPINQFNCISYWLARNKTSKDNIFLNGVNNGWNVE